MSVEGLTRLTIRQEIGKSLAGSDFFVGTTSTGAVDTSSLIDARLFGGADRYNGYWVWIPDSTGSVTNGEEHSRVEDTVIDTPASGDRDLTVRPVFGATIPASGPYELWPPTYSPVWVNDAINRAINTLIGRFYTRQESLALHGDGVTTRFDLPSEFQMVDRVDLRTRVDSQDVHDCESTFDETTDSDFTQALDSEVKKSGQSLKLTVAVGSAAGDFITDSIGSIDISKYTHLEGWLRCSVALDAADYVLHLDDGAAQADGTDLESLNMPAATADIWTFFRVALTAPESDTAIISIAIEHNVDKAAHTIWFDDIKVVDNDSAHWTVLPKQTWDIDQEANDLVFKTGAPSHRLLKISGGAHPSQLTTDAGTSEVPESYIIAKATALMLSGGSRASREDADGRRTLGRDWEALAARELSKLPPLVNARKVA